MPLYSWACRAACLRVRKHGTRALWFSWWSHLISFKARCHGPIFTPPAAAHGDQRDPGRAGFAGQHVSLLLRPANMGIGFGGAVDSIWPAGICSRGIAPD